jgi:YfiH family protein
MIQRQIQGVPFLFFEKLLAFDELWHAVATRLGGISPEPYNSLNLCVRTGDEYQNVLLNYRLLSRILRFDLSTLICSRQIHGYKVAAIDDTYSKNKPFTLKPAVSGFDAMVVSRKNFSLMVKIADCAPIMFFDPVKKVVAMAHAGWRGTLGEIAKETAKVMVDRYESNTKHLLVGIGPSIGPCCFHIKKEVAMLFMRRATYARQCTRQNGDKLSLNLWEANRLQLLQHGIPAENIEMAELCTACHTDLFFSYRREKGKTGRFGALIGLRI